jgi:hypothetical protein
MLDDVCLDDVCKALEVAVNDGVQTVRIEVS